MKTILVVEDDPGIQELLRLNLAVMNFKVSQAFNAEQAWSYLRCMPPDLMLVDWNMPQQSGVELVRSIRRQPDFKPMPIIMVTARYSEQDKLEAFDAGVDDLVCKPFHVRELLARVKSKLARAEWESLTRPLELDDLLVNLDDQKVWIGGVPVKMGETEVRLLYQLVRQPHKVHGRNQLIQWVWGTQGNVQERTVDAYVVRLRRILSEAGCLYQIDTVRAAGYRLVPAGTEAERVKEERQHA